jgi:hypothetical protein
MWGEEFRSQFQEEELRSQELQEYWSTPVLEKRKIKASIKCK